MASRDKKVSLNRKQSTASPVPPKEGATPPETLTKSIIARAEASVGDEAPRLTSIRNPRSNASKNTAAISRKIRKKPAGKVIKKTIALKAKNKKLNQKLNKKFLGNSRNNFEVKQTLLKNGVKAKVSRKAKPNLKKDQNDDSPPVLEPIYPITENQKQTKKKPKKPIDDEKKIKEESNDSLPTIEEALDSILSQCDSQLKASKKKAAAKKSKQERESTKGILDEEIDDLVKTEDIKAEVDSDTEKLDVKNRKPAGSKLDLLETLKKEDIENKEEAENKVIDMLDLNVDKKRNKVIDNRRHSIEKYPIGFVEANVTNLSVFSNVPRSISPRAKRASKVRQSIDSSKRSSPYTTRSDSPARILRNGKHRKLKDMNLLEGLDPGYRKRRRLCSDYSGSEISVSKSGYESDSSYSDLASLHGAENLENFDVKPEIKTGSSPIVQTQDSPNVKATTTNVEAIEANTELSEKLGTRAIDTNSNVCDTESKLDVKMEDENKDNLNLLENTAKVDDNVEYVDAIVSPSAKVPEKSIILDIMKQTFNNDVNSPEQDKEKRATRSSSKKITNDDKETVLNTHTNDVTQQSEEDAENLLLNGDAETHEVPESMEVAEANGQIDNVEEAMQQEETITNGNVSEQNSMEIESNEAQEKKIEIVETPESLAVKESILKALGLQSLRAAEEAKQKSKEKSVPKSDSYTGTLKTVIKLNRNEKKRGKSSLKMTLQKAKKSVREDKSDNDLEESARHAKEVSVI